jgi:hypothetical protein
MTCDCGDGPGQACRRCRERQERIVSALARIAELIDPDGLERHADELRRRRDAGRLPPALGDCTRGCADPKDCDLSCRDPG